METPAQQVNRLVQQGVIPQVKYLYDPCPEGYRCVLLVGQSSYTASASTKKKAMHEASAAALDTIPYHRKIRREKCDHLKRIMADGANIKTSLRAHQKNSEKYEAVIRISLRDVYKTWTQDIALHQLRFIIEHRAGDFIRCPCLGYMPEGDVVG